MIQMWVCVRVQAQNLSSVANSTGELGAPDTENASEQQSNDTQCEGKQVITFLDGYATPLEYRSGLMYMSILGKPHRSRLGSIPSCTPQ